MARPVATMAMYHKFTVLDAVQGAAVMPLPELNSCSTSVLAQRVSAVPWTIWPGRPQMTAVSVVSAQSVMAGCLLM